MSSDSEVEKMETSQMVKVGGALMDTSLINTFKRMKETGRAEISDSESEDEPQTTTAPSVNPMAWLMSLGVTNTGAGGQTQAESSDEESDEEMTTSDNTSHGRYVNVDCMFDDFLPLNWARIAEADPFWKTETDEELQEKLLKARADLLEASKKVHKTAARTQNKRFVGGANR